VTPNAAISSEIQKLSPSAIIEMFELDATLIGGSIYRFHAGKNGIITDLVWNGQTYSAFPIEASGFEWSGKGQLPRPRITIANVLGTLSSMVLAYEDLAGCKVTRIRTLAKYLDAVNFPAQRNFLRYSENISSWTANPTLAISENAILSPIGTMTADTTASLGGTRYIGSSVVVNSQCTHSIYVRPADANKTIQVYADGVFGAAGAFASATSSFNPATLSPIGGAGFDSRGITKAENGWYRAWVTFTPITASAINCHVYPATADVTGWWGAQLDIGAMTDYQPVTGATFSRNATADPTAEFARDIYYIDRKGAENKDTVEFELAAALDLAGIALPRRQIVQNYCPWTYRGSECGYTGTTYFDTNDNSVATAGLDVCGKRLTSCRARFGQYAELPYGGFPAAGLLKV
jgi:phage-related protein